MSETDLDLFVALMHHRWAVPVLAELSRLRGAKFITLVNRVGVSRDSLGRTISALIGQGWVRRNRGYGHPMRPEYILTDQGNRIGPRCARLWDRLTDSGRETVGMKKWALPVVYRFRAGPQRFGDLKSSLPSITARALTLVLKDLAVAGLLERSVIDEYPPTTIYALTAKWKRSVVPALVRLVASVRSAGDVN